MKLLIIYLAGVALSGLFSCLSYKIDGYYDYKVELINEAKQELDDAFLNNEVDINSIINMDIITTSLFSYFGIIFVLFELLTFFVIKHIK